MPRIEPIKEIIDLDMWSGWTTAPLEEEGKDDRARSSIAFIGTMNLFSFDHHNKFLSNAHGSILPRSDVTHNVKGANIYCSFDSLETYKLFFDCVMFKIIKSDKIEIDFSPVLMVVPDPWPRLHPDMQAKITKPTPIIPAPSFDFGICGHVLFEKPIENPTLLQMISEETFVNKMNETAHNRMFHRMKEIEKSARITVKLFGEKTRVVQ